MSLGSPRFSINIDHLSEEQLNFFGWYEVDRSGPIGAYRRMHDGAEQYIHDGPPRRMFVDDYNDAQQMSQKDDEIVIAPIA